MHRKQNVVTSDFKSKICNFCAKKNYVRIPEYSWRINKNLLEKKHTTLGSSQCDIYVKIHNRFENIWIAQLSRSEGCTQLSLLTKAQSEGLSQL